MYLRANRRFKDGKEHRYWSVEESRRLPSGRVAQRRVLYLGEINDSQPAAWRKTLEVFDETEQRARRLSLFPEDREVPADALDAVQVKRAEMELRRARAFGNYWLGAFWEARLARGREEVAWAKVLELLVVSRLVSPDSEFRLHRQGFDPSALGDLLRAGFAVAEKDRLDRCLDRIVEHKAALFDPLRQRGQDLFQARFDVLLYDLTKHLYRGRGGRDSQGEIWLQSGPTVRLPAGGHRPGAHPGRVSTGLRSHGREHVGSNDVAGISGEDRSAVRTGSAGLDDGAGNSDGGRVGGDARPGARSV
jgi:hypothetical protein